jgi:FkbM family methyltransferase
MNPNLIFDVGMHNGDDTAYYLHRGYRVVSVEADPTLAAAAEIRFSSAIADGRLEIVNKAITAGRGEVDFWICDALTVWNSFDPTMATRQGMESHPIKVPTVPMRDLFSQYGVPHYLKLDIEGQDHVAASDIDSNDLPTYVSLEITSVDDFYVLRSKGYKQFKCIQQGSFTPVESPALSLHNVFSQAVTRLKSSQMANRLRSAYYKRRVPTDINSDTNSWNFDPGSSGPFGEDTPGEWMAFEQVLHAWLSQKIGHELGYRATVAGDNIWFDLHARIS